MEFKVQPSTPNAYRILRHREIADINDIAVYRQYGGFEAFEKAVTSMMPEELVDLVKASDAAAAAGQAFQPV